MSVRIPVAVLLLLVAASRMNGPAMAQDTTPTAPGRVGLELPVGPVGVAPSRTIGLELPVGPVGAAKPDAPADAKSARSDDAGHEGEKSHGEGGHHR